MNLKSRNARSTGTCRHWSLPVYLGTTMPRLKATEFEVATVSPFRI